MLKTGKDFDMNPDTFTLENLFSMELHNFADTIAEIVTAASKELSIEKGLKEVNGWTKWIEEALIITNCLWYFLLAKSVTNLLQVVETWEIMKFTVMKYMKGTQDRGFILGKKFLFLVFDNNLMFEITLHNCLETKIGIILIIIVAAKYFQYSS